MDISSIEHNVHQWFTFNRISFDSFRQPNTAVVFFSTKEIKHCLGRLLQHSCRNSLKTCCVCHLLRFRPLSSPSRITSMGVLKCEDSAALLPLWSHCLFCLINSFAVDLETVLPFPRHSNGDIQYLISTVWGWPNNSSEADFFQLCRLTDKLFVSSWATCRNFLH